MKRKTETTSKTEPRSKLSALTLGQTSLRDYFAGQALPVIINTLGTTDTIINIARSAYDFADAMLLVRKSGAGN
jgi:hypothetical protein